MTEGLTPEENRVYRQMMTTPGLEFAYELGRSAETVTRDGTGQGFSEAAMDSLIRHMIGFIASRISRYYDQHSVMPQQMTVRIRVAMDAQPKDFDDSLPVTELGPVLRVGDDK